MRPMRRLASLAFRVPVWRRCILSVERQHIEQEPVGAVPPGAISRCRQGIAAFCQVISERFAEHRSPAGPFALIAMREHDEAAIPVGWHIDQVASVP